MSQETGNYLNRIISRIEVVTKYMEAIATSLFDGLIRLLERTYHSIVAITIRIKDGLFLLAKSIGKLLFVALKLCLLYSPSLFYFGGGYWKVFGIFWFLLSTILWLINKDSSVSGVVQCPKCQQKLRARFFRDVMTMRCPKCSHEFKAMKRSDNPTSTNPASV